MRQPRRPQQRRRRIGKDPETGRPRSRHARQPGLQRRITAVTLPGTDRSTWRVAVLRDERGLQIHRLHVIYWAILSAVSSALLICLVIVGAFIGALLEFEVSRLIAVLFILAVVSMVFALVLFLREVYLMIDAHDIYNETLHIKPTLSQERHSSSIK